MSSSVHLLPRRFLNGRRSYEAAPDYQVFWLPTVSRWVVACRCERSFENPGGHVELCETLDAARNVIRGHRVLSGVGLRRG